MNASTSDVNKNPSSGGMQHEATISDDKRATEYLANERTFLAWVRTGISIITLGFVMAKFSVWLRELAVRFDPQAQPVQTGASLPIGVTMMILGGVLTVLAARRYCVVNGSIARGHVTADHGLIILVTLMVALLSLAMITYMLLTSGKP
jgi:putative membrane protein